MAVRNIVKIDEAKCNGCGQCVTACAEGAIELVNGKAKLVSEVYCDGLGACIGHCPEDAITVEQRDAAEFDEQATKKRLEEMKITQSEPGFVCPGMMSQTLKPTNTSSDQPSADIPSQLTQWPVQLKLVPPNAPYFANSDLLLVADCVPFAMGDFHSRFLKDHSIAVGCPKLDDVQFYIEKLAKIIQTNDLNSLIVIHMQVPCCSGLTMIAQKAIEVAGLNMAFEDITIALDGNVLKTEQISVSTDPLSLT
ncbi:MAG: ATP-binding protein [Planctomycetota bacterium]